jgi:hypothetical protein
VTLPTRLVREEHSPMCISANAKPDIDDAMLSYFGYDCGWSCEKFQFLSTGSNTAHWKNLLAIGEYLEPYIQATGVAHHRLVRDLGMT